MKTKHFISVLALIALTTLASAQNRKDAPAPMPKGGTEKGVCFVDANNNGICDNYENNNQNCGSCRKSGGNSACEMGGKRMMGQGNCQGMGQGKGNGKNFVDADKNGICDNFEAAGKK